MGKDEMKHRTASDRRDFYSQKGRGCGWGGAEMETQAPADGKLNGRIIFDGAEYHMRRQDYNPGVGPSPHDFLRFDHAEL